MDALVSTGDEGRVNHAKSLGEPEKGYDPGVSEWENLARVNASSSLGEHIAQWKPTGGSEPSQYP